jgi:hypothetical protein
VNAALCSDSTTRAPGLRAGNDVNLVRKVEGGLVMSIFGHAHLSNSKVSYDRAKHDESGYAHARSLRYLVSISESRILLVFVVAAGAMGLIRFGFPVSTQEQRLANANLPVGANLERSEVLRVWMPQVLIELAKCEFTAEAMRTHGGLRRLLERRGQEKLWYATLVRGHNAGGDFIDVPFIRQPYNEPDFFPELREMLALAMGNSPGEPAERFLTTSFSLLPENLLKRTPREAIADLLSDPSPPLSAQRMP